MQVREYAPLCLGEGLCVGKGHRGWAWTVAGETLARVRWPRQLEHSKIGVRPPAWRGTEVVVTGAPRKRLVPQGARGFESPPLRHLPSLRSVGGGSGGLQASSGSLDSSPFLARIPPLPTHSHELRLAGPALSIAGEGCPYLEPIASRRTSRRRKQSRK